MSKKELLDRLQDPDYRNEFVSSEIDVGLPMQLRAMREKRGWKQSFVADQTGTKQPRFSLMEKPGYGNFSLNTLKKLAVLFDVGLIVSFVPWGEMIDFANSLSHRRLAILPFREVYGRLASAYSKERHTTGIEDQQLGLSFSTGISTVAPVHGTSREYEHIEDTGDSLRISRELLAGAHLATIRSGGNGSYVNTR